MQLVNPRAKLGKSSLRVEIRTSGLSKTQKLGMLCTHNIAAVGGGPEVFKIDHESWISVIHKCDVTRERP
jgi:hypothetical protein